MPNVYVKANVCLIKTDQQCGNCLHLHIAMTSNVRRCSRKPCYPIRSNINLRQYSGEKVDKMSTICTYTNIFFQTFDQLHCQIPFIYGYACHDNDAVTLSVR